MKWMLFLGFFDVPSHAMCRKWVFEGVTVSEMRPPAIAGQTIGCRGMDDEVGDESIRGLECALM